MIRAELRTITGRRGSFWSAIAIPAATVLVVVAVMAGLHAWRPARFESVGGSTTYTVAIGVASFATLVTAVILGALAGAYDTANGTLRYRVMTGVGRWRLFAVRIPALLLAYLVAFAPAVVLATAAAFLPHEPGTGVSLRTIAEFTWSLYLGAAVFGLVSMAIGSLLDSTGPAIAISLLVNLGAAPLLGLLGIVNERIATFMLPHAVTVLSTFGSSVGEAGLAAGVLAAWLGVLLLLGGLRLSRNEV